MRTIKLQRVNNDINGNPVYEIDIFDNPELKKLGKKKRNSDNIRRLSSYNPERTLSRYITEPFNLCIEK
jgi:hypothetical protein